MTESNLFQLAQVVTDLPMHHHQYQDPPSSVAIPNSRDSKNCQPLLVRKVTNCIICFHNILNRMIECLYCMCYLLHLFKSKYTLKKKKTNSTSYLLDLLFSNME